MDNTFDRLYYNRGELIAGVDEAGVTDIAGPLIAACVILPKIEDLSSADLRIFEVNDSKKIPEKYRVQHAEVVWENAIAIGIGEVTPREMDYLGLHRAIALAQTRAVAACKKTGTQDHTMPDFLMVDGSGLVHTEIEQENIEKGDEKSLCIAAASVVAKVYRDQEMINLHRKHPYYGWDSNKGFPCEQQFKGLDEYGAVPGVHRFRAYPFVNKGHNRLSVSRNNKVTPSKEQFWQRRRKLWKRKTEEGLIDKLKGDVWTIKNRSYEHSKSSKNSTQERVKQKPLSSKQSTQSKEKQASTVSS
jgi:ribonuclease HII